MRLKVDPGAEGVEVFMPKHLFERWRATGKRLSPAGMSFSGAGVVSKVIGSCEMEVRIGPHQAALKVMVYRDDPSKTYALLGRRGMQRLRIECTRDGLIFGEPGAARWRDPFVPIRAQVDDVGTDPRNFKVPEAKIQEAGQNFELKKVPTSVAANPGRMPRRELPYSVKKKLDARKRNLLVAQRKYEELGDQALTITAGKKLLLKVIKDEKRDIADVVKKFAEEFPEEFRERFTQICAKRELVFKGLGKFKGFMLDFELKPGIDYKPVRKRLVRSPVERATECAEVQAMLDVGVIEDADSSFGIVAQTVFVPKEDGSLRYCGNFDRLNRIVFFDEYPFPNLRQLVQTVSRWPCVVKVDLSAAFWQCEIAPHRRNFFVVYTERGLKRYTRVPFGFVNSMQMLQRALDYSFKEFPFVAGYADDLTIGGDSVESCLANFETFLDRCVRDGWTLNLDKCEFIVDGRDYRLLGYTVVPGLGYRPRKDKVQAILDFARPRTVNELQSFLGMANVYFYHVPRYALVIAPLTAMVNPKNLDEELEWGEEAIVAVEELRRLIVADVMVRAPVVGWRKILVTDASQRGMGVMIYQLNPVTKKREVLEFWSKAFTPAQQEWPSWKREYFTVFNAFQRFGHIIRGEPGGIEVHVDAEALLPMKESDHPEIKRWSMLLQSFKFDIFAKSGVSKEMIGADWASRLFYNPSAGVNEMDKEIEKHFLPIERFEVDNVEAVAFTPARGRISEFMAEEYVRDLVTPDHTLFDGATTADDRLIKQLFRLHTSTVKHRSASQMIECLEKGMRARDDLVKAKKFAALVPSFCDLCQLRQRAPKDSKGYLKGRTYAHPDKLGSLIKDRLFGEVAVDHYAFKHDWKDPDSGKGGRVTRWFLTMVDAASGIVKIAYCGATFPGGLHLTGAGEEVGEQGLKSARRGWLLFYRKWVLEFGIPESVRCDQGFGKALRKTPAKEPVLEWLQNEGVKAVNSIPRRPESNGIVERVNGFMGKWLDYCFAGYFVDDPESAARIDFQEVADWMALEWNQFENGVTGIAPSEFLCGQKFVLPASRPDPNDRIPLAPLLDQRINKVTLPGLRAIRAMAVHARKQSAIRKGIKNFMKKGYAYEPVVGDLVYVLNVSEQRKEQALIPKNKALWRGPAVVLNVKSNTAVVSFYKTKKKQEIPWTHLRQVRLSMRDL